MGKQVRRFYIGADVSYNIHQWQDKKNEAMQIGVHLMALSRRRFLQTGGSALAATGLPATLTGAKAPSSSKPQARPNIIFIVTDQQSASMMGCAGNKHLATPAMDRLAAEGIRFEKAFACNPVCLPNRFSFMTGHMPSRVGIGLNEDGHKAAMPESLCRHSLGRLMQKAGYETAYGGKTHLPPALHPRKNGFQFLTGDSRMGLAETCSRYIKTPRKKPFFLFASFINPHDICYMAINAYRRTQGQKPIGNIDSRTMEQLIAQARAGNLDDFVDKHCPPLPANFKIPADEPECITTHYTKVRPFRHYVRTRWPEAMWRLHRWAYCRLTEMVDAEIDVLLKGVRESGQAGNTLIIFTSDHGDMDGAHGLEHKSVLYEESVNVPMIMHWPGVIPAGRVDGDHLVSNGLDLLPTLCDYAGIAPPAGLAGRSLRPLAGKRPAPPWRDCVFAESQSGRMARTADFKYNIYEAGKHREQLIDLKNDPGEMVNLAADPAYSKVLGDFRRRLSAWTGEISDKTGKKYILPG